jgi:hypothetical protein
MRISTKDVELAFDDLLAGRKPREEIAAWAMSMRAEDDRGDLQYDPPAAQSGIWRALDYLGGVDLKDQPDSYLHTEEDFWKFRRLWRA